MAQNRDIGRISRLRRVLSARRGRRTAEDQPRRLRQDLAEDVDRLTRRENDVQDLLQLAAAPRLVIADEENLLTISPLERPGITDAAQADDREAATAEDTDDPDAAQGT